MVASGVGRVAGEGTATQTVAAGQTMQAREDGSAWLWLMTNNESAFLSTYRPGRPSLRAPEVGAGMHGHAAAGVDCGCRSVSAGPLDAAVILAASYDWIIRNLGGARVGLIGGGGKAPAAVVLFWGGWDGAKWRVGATDDVAEAAAVGPRFPPPS
jgi:hypothetical protein